MADWTAPFHAPTFTTDEYEAQKAKYVAENGYTITVPGLSDIIHFSTPEPMTYTEKQRWENKAWSYFSKERLAELRELKAKKRKRFIAMLGSPSPSIVTNAGSIMTSLDDAQDAISTLAMIGRIAVKFAPRLLARVFLGPVGWLLTANDILNLIIHCGQKFTMPLMSKRGKEQATQSNPFSKKAKLRRATKLLKAMPSKGDIIQALQTTDQIFGFGISLGPIVGLAQDIAAGGVRSALGQEVKVKLPWKGVENFTNTAFRSIRSSAYALALPWKTDDTMFSEIYLANYLANQHIMPIQQEWNPLDQVEDIEGVEGLPPTPTDVLTLEIIAEEGLAVEEITGWPHVNTPYANYSDFADFSRPLATKNLQEFMTRNQHNWHGYTAGVLASEAAMYQIANLEGESDVAYDYSAASKIAGNLLSAGYYVDPENHPARLKNFTDYIEWAEMGAVSSGIKEVLKYCSYRGIKLRPITDQDETL